MNQAEHVKKLREINQLNQTTWEVFERIKDRPAALVPSFGAPAGSPEEMFEMAKRIAKATPEIIAADIPVPTALVKKRRRGRPPGLVATYRRKEIRRASSDGARDLEYCRRLDNVKMFKTPAQWRSEGCPESYVAAWKHPQRKERSKWRKRINDERYNALRKTAPGPQSA